MPKNTKNYFFPLTLGVAFLLIILLFIGVSPMTGVAGQLYRNKVPLFADTIIYNSCTSPPPRSDTADCIASCPIGYTVIGGGCSAEGSSSIYTQVFANRPVPTNDGWYRKTTSDANNPTNMVASGYVVCIRE